MYFRICNSAAQKLSSFATIAMVFMALAVLIRNAIKFPLGELKQLPTL